jgi:hypothetical protein
MTIVVDNASVLDALFTLNRRAKRCRDLAQTYYRNQMHGFAKAMQTEKESIYKIKGQALEHLLRLNEVSVIRHQRFSCGNWAEVLEGKGYIFHRPCPPRNESEDDVIIESIEAKPKGSKEPTLKAAQEILTYFLEGKEAVAVYEWPTTTHQQHRSIALGSWYFYDEDEDEDDLDDCDDWYY